jgi:nicotinamide mononucleotide transporter
VEAVEAAAVACGVAYILLAIREHRGCWIAGGIGTALYAVVFFDSGLPMQAALQLLYVAMSVYGWLAWRRRPDDVAGASTWPLARHAAALAGIAIATAVSAPLAARYAVAAAPVTDSLGTWASVFATWLLARRVVDTWIWWIAIDVGLAALFANQGLWMTAGLYIGYAFLAAAGGRNWRARRAAT